MNTPLQSPQSSRLLAYEGSLDDVGVVESNGRAARSSCQRLSEDSEWSSRMGLAILVNKKRARSSNCVSELFS